MSDIEHKDSLSTEELNTVLAFSQGLYNGFGGYGFYKIGRASCRERV